MGQGHQAIVESLYALYKDKGFLQEKEALDLMSTNDVSLVAVSRITDKLMALGVIFSDGVIYDDDDIDRTRTDYNAIYSEVLAISPRQRVFIDYVKNIRPPQYREWRPLIVQANSGNVHAFNRLFDMYLRIVVRIALRFHKKNGFELDDAIQEGSMGLARGIKQYDSSKHDTLSSYLPFWIQQYIGRAVLDQSRTIRIPVHAYEIAQRLSLSQRELFAKTQVEPTYDEIANEAKTSAKTAITLLEAMQETISLDLFFEEATEELIYKYFAIPSSEEEAENDSLIEVINKNLSKLTIKESSVLSLRYGLSDGIERTLEEVGNIFNVTRERVRQIEAKAFSKLRHPARAKLLRDFI